MSANFVIHHSGGYSPIYEATTLRPLVTKVYKVRAPLEPTGWHTEPGTPEGLVAIVPFARTYEDEATARLAAMYLTLYPVRPGVVEVDA